MSDQYTAVNAPAPGTYTEQAPAPAQQVLTEGETAELQALYDQLKPQAIAEARKFINVRTPTKYAAEMNALIDADFPPPPEA